jgi:uncharacterized membrane protein YgdD (TMEM256/DUF423 family)
VNWIFVGAVLGLLGVMAGAFGAHGLKSSLAPDRLEIFEVAVRYQIYHAIALVLAGMLNAPRAGWGFFLGTLIFSGSLYLLVMTNQRWLGAVTPIGGILFLVGWVFLAASTR